MKGRIQTLLRNSSWSAVAQLAEKALRFLTIPLLLAAYGRENFGLIAVVLAIRGYLSILAMGAPAGVVRFAASWLQKKDLTSLRRCGRTLLSFYLLVGVLNALVFVGFGWWGLGLFHIHASQEPLLRNMFFMAGAYVLVFWPAQLVSQLLEGAEEIHFVQKCQGFRAVLDFLWVLAVVQWEVRLDVYFGIRLLLTLVVYPILLHRWSRYSSGHRLLRLGWHWREFQPVLSYGISAFAVGFFCTSFMELRPVVLGMRGLSVGAVTDFAVLVALVTILLMAGSWIVRPLIPSASKAMAGGDQDYLDFITYRGTKYFWSLITLPLVWLIVNAETVLVVYAGEEYAHLAPWLVLMTFASLDAYLSPMAGIIFAAGKLRPYVYSNAVIGLSGLVIVWWGAPAWGASSAVLATVIYWLLQFAYHHFYYFPRVLHIDSWKLFRSAFLAPSLAAGGTCLILLGAHPILAPLPSFVQLVLSLCLGCLAHATLICSFALDAGERGYLTRTLRNRIPLKTTGQGM